MNSKKNAKRMLNLGCGKMFHPNWVNVDVVSNSPHVLAFDLNLGIPFAAESFDIVYHSHILEHLERPYAEHLLQECFRVLKPGGLLRVVVPDLENIVRAYLAALEAARAGEQDAHERHQWMLIELLDQMVRPQSGGEMLRWWQKKPVPQKEFIISRVGKEAEDAIESLRDKPIPPCTLPTPLPLLNADFIQSGELHKWMYDDISLSTLLQGFGFERVERKAHNNSSCPELMQYKLDTLENGSSRKPDSFFLEAYKPVKEKPTALRVAMLSSADSGGAGTATMRLHQALQRLNSEKQVAVINHLYCAMQKKVCPGVSLMPGPGQHVVRHPAGSGTVAISGYTQFEKRLGETLRAYPQRPAGREYYSMPNLCCNPGHTPLIEDFDIINLHWVAGMCDPALAPQAFQGRPIVWTLHDMAPFTGGCHYSGSCTRFTAHCGECPELGSCNSQDLSFQTWRLRMEAYRKLDLHIVCPSAWLAEQAKQSSLLTRFPVHVIPNAHPFDVFQPLQREKIRDSLGLATDDLVLVFSAQGLNNERKGVGYLLEALRMLATMPLGAQTRLLLLGGNPPPAFFQTGLRADAVGHVDNQEQMAALYNAADVVVVPSLEDNLPNVICEAAGCGTPVVAFAAGGIPEMVRHKETGWLAPVRDVQSLVTGIHWADAALHDVRLRKRCRVFALEQWDEKARAQDYLKLFRNLCRRG